MKKTIFTLFALCCLQFAYAQNLEKIVSKDYVDNLIKTLSDDNMSGRRTFTPGIDKAATFIEGEFKKIGLKPLDGLKGYRQSFDKYSIKVASAAVTVNGKTLDPANYFTSAGLFEKMNFDQTSGAEIIRIGADKNFMTEYRSLSRSTKKNIVLVDPKFSTEFKRFKTMPARDRIIDMKDLKVDAPLNVFILDAPADLKTYTVEVKNTLTKMPAIFNVAGMIPGHSKKNEIVIFSGHYDHLGIGKPMEQDSIFNGADDDASGTTAVIALAKYYKALNNNERTLIFVAFTAEEIGGYGARYFSSQVNPDDVVAMFNIEMIGKDSKFGPNTAYITGYERSDFGKILQKNLEGTEFNFHPDPYPSENLFYRSDNATLAALGVPAHTISTVQIDQDKLYHSVKDDYSSLDTENIYSTIKGIAKSAIGIIKGVDTPTRIPKVVN